MCWFLVALSLMCEIINCHDITRVILDPARFGLKLDVSCSSMNEIRGELWHRIPLSYCTNLWFETSFRYSRMIRTRSDEHILHFTWMYDDMRDVLDCVWHFFVLKSWDIHACNYTPSVCNVLLQLSSSAKKLYVISFNTIPTCLFDHKRCPNTPR